MDRIRKHDEQATYASSGRRASRRRCRRHRPSVRVRADRVAGRAHDRLVERIAGTAERPPADLEGAEALCLDLLEMCGQGLGSSISSEA